MPPTTATDRYKWIALSNTTLGVLMATVNSSILLIALPDIFRGIHIDPLAPGNTNYLLWMILSFLVVTAVLVVSLGRLGDVYGRVRMYNLGFAVFTLGSILLSVTWMSGGAAAVWMIGMRVVQGIGGAMLFANSAAILTDAFPSDQRGLALGINGVAAIAGSFIGLVLGGILAPIQWRLVFVVSVPIGVFGTVWAYRKLVDLSPRRQASMSPNRKTCRFAKSAFPIRSRPRPPSFSAGRFRSGAPESSTHFRWRVRCCLKATARGSTRTL